MKQILVAIFSLIIAFALFVGVMGGLVALMVWLLKSIGVTTIGEWTVAFSWKLVLLVSVILTLLKSSKSIIFKEREY